MQEIVGEGGLLTSMVCEVLRTGLEVEMGPQSSTTSGQPRQRTGRVIRDTTIAGQIEAAL